GGEQGGQGPLVMAPGRRPGWLLPVPQALSETGLQLLGQAERIESGWWDGGDVRRDYYRIETCDGLRGWAFRDLAAPGPLWLQGWFA
ncbi:DNA repair nucleotidyltransferase, partial [Pseudomonas sp. FW305-42]